LGRNPFKKLRGRLPPLVKGVQEYVGFQVENGPALLV